MIPYNDTIQSGTLGLPLKILFTERFIGIETATQLQQLLSASLQNFYALTAKEFEKIFISVTDFAAKMPAVFVVSAFWSVDPLACNWLVEFCTK